MKAIQKTKSLYIGLMSGTSMDGIDAVLIDLKGKHSKILGKLDKKYPEKLQHQLLKASQEWENTNINQLGRLDHWVGEIFRDAVLELIKKSNVNAHNIVAIGSHGQTIRHQPHDTKPFSMQIGDPNVIAAGTGITTVSDFRRKDIAAGGEGAPLTPIFHHILFYEDKINRVVINLGGITNLTIINKNINHTSGFDSGPGNTLMDKWIQENLNQPFDSAGKWASQGITSKELLKDLLADPYFERSPPKSTGFEYFNIKWLRQYLTKKEISPVDIQRTLVCLTVESIYRAIMQSNTDIQEVIFCGGGIKNNTLMNEIRARLKDFKISITDDYGMDSDYLEAAAFAFLAKQTLSKKAGNIPLVTGANQAEILGGIYLV